MLKEYKFFRNEHHLFFLACSLKLSGLASHIAVSKTDIALAQYRKSWTTSFKCDKKMMIDVMDISEVLKYLSNFSIYQLEWAFQNSLTHASANTVHLPQAYVFLAETNRPIIRMISWLLRYSIYDRYFSALISNNDLFSSSKSQNTIFFCFILLKNIDLFL